MSDSGKKLTSRSRVCLLLLITALPFAVLSLIAAPLYILNDDLQIASVLSGAYSGTPDLHTVYMRAPVSFLLSLLYRILPMVPWFGVFLCGTVFLCAFLVMRSCAGKAEDPKQFFFNILPVYGAVLLFHLLLFWQPHYTVVAACAGATAIFLMIRIPGDASTREQRLPYLPVFGLLLLCDQIRSQVFFMLLPFVGMAVLFCFLRQEKKREWLKKVLFLWLGFVLLWTGLYALHRTAYAGEEWQEYLKLNQARTELYDYTLVWESSEAREWYRECGVTDDAYPLYRYYDLLPDTTVTAERLAKMAEFQESSRTVTGGHRLKNVLYDLRVRTLGTGENSDFPYAYLVIFLYIATAILALMEKKYRLLLPLFGSGSFHVLIYGWLIWQGRAPERVTMSLYMTESFLLLAMFLTFMKKELLRGLLAALLLLFALIPAVVDAFVGYREQNSVNYADDVIYSFMADHPDEFFLLETSAAVNCTAPVFRQNLSERNYVLMGGWLFGSPLQKEKLQAFGYADVADLFAKGGFSCIFKRDYAPSYRGTDYWVGLMPVSLGWYLEEYTGLKMEHEVGLMGVEDYRDPKNRGNVLFWKEPDAMQMFYMGRVRQKP